MPQANVGPLADSPSRVEHPHPARSGPNAACRHIAITGAGSGIGRAIALRLAGQGALLSLLGRDFERLQQTAAAAAAGGASAVASFRCDIRQRDEVDAAFASAAERHGGLHALVANAGVGGGNAPGPADRFEELIATNLGGTYACVRAAQRAFAPAPEPRQVIVIASVLARIGVAGYTGYCASKAGLLGLVRALAMEWAEQPIQVNAICPGWVDTDMAAAGFRGIAAHMGTDERAAREHALSAVPLRRISQPEEVAGTVAWLLSPDARGVTGQAIDVNNGAWMG